MFFTPNHWLKDWTSFRQLPLSKPRRGPYRPRLEDLESRLAPAWDLTISTMPTANVLHDTLGNFIAHGSSANIDVADIRADLLAGKDVMISNGDVFTASSDIIWQASSPLDYDGIGIGRTLSILADPTSQASALFALHSAISDSNLATVDALTLDFQAQHGLTVDANLASRGGTISLYADAAGWGSGTLTVLAGASVYSTNSGSDSITLRAADLDLQGSVSANAPVTFASGLEYPTSEAFDASGNLFVSNYYPGGIYKITPAGAVSTFVSGLSYSWGIAFDSVGDLYVAQTYINTISKITPAGVVSTFVSSGLNCPWGLAFDSHGDLYVSNYYGNTISKITPAGVVTPFVTTGLSYPTALAFDAADNLYVANTNSNSIIRITPAGAMSTFVSSGINGPYGLTFDTGGNLYVANVGDDTVSKVTPLGEVSPYVTSGLSGPMGLAFDAFGALFVANQSSGTIVRAEGGSGGSVIVRSSVPSRPMSIGGTDSAVAGINLTDAELARITNGAGGTFTFGDGTQTGDITFTTAAPASSGGVVETRQSATGAGRIFLDTGGSGGTALSYPGDIRLTAGTGGIFGNGMVGTRGFDLFITGPGRLEMTSAGNVGSSTTPIYLRVPSLGTSNVMGDLFLTTDTGFTTSGTLNATGAMVFEVASSGGSFGTHAGHLNASSVTVIVGNYPGGGSGTNNVATDGQALTHLIHRGDGVLTLTDNLTLTGNFTQEAGASNVNITGRSITLAGDWNWGNSGTLISTFSTVIFNGLNQTIRGNNTFYHLTKTVSSADTLTFEAGATQVVAGILNLQGTDGNLLALRSTIPGTQAILNPQGYRTVSYLDVKDNFNLNAYPLSPTNSVDSGNNTNWLFAGSTGVTSLKALAGTPQSAVVATRYGMLVTQVTDGLGRPVRGVKVTFTITAGATGASGTFARTAVVTTDASGVAIAPALTANKKAGAFTVSAAAPGVFGIVTFNLTNLPGAPAGVYAVAGTPQTAVIGTAYAKLFQARVTDIYGNRIANVAVTFAAPTTGPSGTFGGLVTVMTDANGIATAPAFTANGTVGSFVVTAKIPGKTAARYSLRNLAVTLFGAR